MFMQYKSDQTLFDSLYFNFKEPQSWNTSQVSVGMIGE